MKKIRLVLSTSVLLVILCACATAQFPQSWSGTWKGTMHIYRSGKLVDSVDVTHIIKPSDRAGSYVWRTEYRSAMNPMVKDYVLRTKDAEKGIYVIDEGEGLELISYLMGGRLFSTFEVKGIMLTANYEMKGSELVFEVTSGKKDSATGGGVINYAVTSLQRVVLRKSGD